MATLRQRNHKWEVQIRRKGSLPHSKTFTYKQDACRWARAQERLLDLGHTLPPPLTSQTLGDLLTRYATEITPQKKGAAVEQRRIARLLQDPIHRYPVASITRTVITEFRDRRLMDGPIACRHDLAILQHCFNIARHEWDYVVPDNPVQGLRKPPPSRPRSRRLHPGEYQQLYQTSMSMRCPYLWPIIELALETAMRKGEILSVKWEHVYWNKRMLYLPDSKNGEDRWIPLSPKAYTLCRTLPQTSPFLFTVSSNALRLSWDRLVLKADITGLRFHDLRHEAISRMVEKGLSVFQVSLITGHKNMAMVRRYAHLKPAIKPSLIGHK